MSTVFKMWKFSILHNFTRADGSNKKMTISVLCKILRPATKGTARKSMNERNNVLGIMYFCLCRAYFIARIRTISSF